jgi:hypothetical protein
MELLTAFIMSKYGAVTGAIILTALTLGYRRLPEKYKAIIKEALTAFRMFRKR